MDKYDTNRTHPDSGFVSRAVESPLREARLWRGEYEEKVRGFLDAMFRRRESAHSSQTKRLRAEGDVYVASAHRCCELATPRSLASLQRESPFIATMRVMTKRADDA
ncbi:MAG: hypothetical protein C0483_25310 [Pirellula sp.]|nr:hypothetical protein [Pirellula sp.]